MRDRVHDEGYKVGVVFLRHNDELGLVLAGQHSPHPQTIFTLKRSLAENVPRIQLIHWSQSLQINE